MSGTSRRTNRRLVRIRVDPDIDLGQTYVKTGLFTPRDAKADDA